MFFDNFANFFTKNIEFWFEIFAKNLKFCETCSKIIVENFETFFLFFFLFSNQFEISKMFYLKNLQFSIEFEKSNFFFCLSIIFFNFISIFARLSIFICMSKIRDLTSMNFCRNETTFSIKKNILNNKINLKNHNRNLRDRKSQFLKKKIFVMRIIVSQ